MPAPAELRFAKYQGLGNDFVIVDARSSGALVTAEVARRVCDRRRGVGGDGLITLLPSRDTRASLRMHIYNADGSVPEMCGNGLRCVVHLLGAERAVVVDTDAGLREGAVVSRERVRVTLGQARVIEESLSVSLGAETRAAMGISMGNPHLVLRPFDASRDLRALAEEHGATLEKHPSFPQRTNVEFPAVLGPRSIRLVVYERGAGITDACGTGASACAFALRRWNLVERTGSLAVELPGGLLEVEITEDGQVAITGPAARAFDGVTAL